MSNDTPQYQLRRAATVTRHKTEEGSYGKQKGYDEIIRVEQPDGSRLIDLYPDEFDNLFVEVDMVQLRKQVEEVVQEAIRLEKNAQIISTKRAVVARATDRILGLLTQGSET